jgi:lipoyl-dependent peroxiredoxin
VRKSKMAIRTAKATWKGGLPGGSGHLATGSGAVDTTYSFGSRFEEDPGSNPEELIAAAHAGCFAMALSGNIGRAGHSPEQVDVEGRVRLEKDGAGFTIREIILVCEARVAGIDDAAFQELVEATRTGCPVSRALQAVPIRVEARVIAGT